MRPVDEALERQMWQLAEQGDEQAIRFFGSTHPELRDELNKRSEMLKGLRTEGARVHRTVDAPAFRPATVRPAVPRPMVAAVAALCLAAIGLATYTALTLLQPAPAVIAPAPKPNLDIPKPRQEGPVVYKNAPVAPDPSQATVPSPPAPEAVVPAYLKPQDVKIDRAPLLTALEFVASQGGLRMVADPQMPNPSIKVAYHQRNTLEILRDLGRQYGFTAFDQGDGSVLVIPAVEDLPETNEPAGSEPPSEEGLRPVPR